MHSHEPDGYGNFVFSTSLLFDDIQDAESNFLGLLDPRARMGTDAQLKLARIDPGEDLGAKAWSKQHENQCYQAKIGSQDNPARPYDGAQHAAVPIAKTRKGVLRRLVRWQTPTVPLQPYDENRDQGSFM